MTKFCSRYRINWRVKGEMQGLERTKSQQNNPRSGGGGVGWGRREE